MSVVHRSVDVVVCDAHNCRNRSFAPGTASFTPSVESGWFTLESKRLSGRRYLCSPACVHAWLTWNWTRSVCDGGAS